MVEDPGKEQDINDELFSLWETGIETGEEAMLRLMVKMELIREPIAGLIMEAIRSDKIGIQVNKGELDRFLNDKQANITILYKEMFGIK